MFDRLVNVAVTYLMRPMVWVVGGIYIVVLGFTLANAFRESASPRSVALQAAFPEMTSWGPLVDLNSMSPDANFATRHLRDVVAVLHQPTVLRVEPSDTPANANMQPLTVFTSAHLRQLRDAPNLRSLTLGSPIMLTDAELQALGELSQLESLSLARCNLGPGVWQQLARLPNLRYLDLSGCSLGGDYSGLESLSHLVTLILGTPRDGGIIEHDASLFPELHRLPRLRTLVVSDYSSAAATRSANSKHPHPLRVSPSVPVNPLIANIDDLRRISTLRRLFINEQSATFPGYAVPERELPGVEVRPAFVDADRQQAYLVLIFLNSNLLMLLALQIHSQFSHAGARLIPNYTLPHVIPVVCLWLTGIFTHCIPLVARGVPFPAALGANLASWTILCSAGIFGSLTDIDPRRLRWIMLPLIAIAVSWFPLSMILLHFNRSSADWYLRGQEPIWTVLFVVSGVVAAAVALRQSLRLHSIYLERGIGSPPLSMDPVAMAEWQQHAYWRNGRLAEKVANRHLARVISRANQPGWRRRCNLWIAGNSNNGRVVLWLMLGVVLIGFLGAQIDDRWMGDFPAIRHPLLLVMSVFFPDLPVIAVASLWRNRRRVFSAESLRPLSRAEFCRQIATAIAWDLSPLAAVYLAVVCWYVAVADPLRWSWGWTAAILLAFVARWIAVFGLVLWGLVIRRDWQMALVSAIAGYTLLFINLGFAFLEGPVLGVGHLPPDLPQLGALSLAGLALIFTLITSSVAALAYRRWQRVELL